MAEDWKDKLAGAFGIEVPSVEESSPQQAAPKQSLSEFKQRSTLIVSIDRRHRAGKQVTLVSGFEGDDSLLEELARQLKAKCGSGGSSKDGEIIIQGDFRDKIVTVLGQMGYKAKRGN